MTVPTRNSQWPDFEPMFETSTGFAVPPYLMLLNLNSDSVQAVNLLKGILNQHNALTDQIVAVL